MFSSTASPLYVFIGCISFLQVSSFNYFELFSFVPFYFHESIFYAFNNLQTFKRLLLVKNKVNLKTETMLTALSGILFYPNYVIIFIGNLN